MNKYIIVLANAGLSGNFLVRLLHLSNNITWKDNDKKTENIISLNADDQWINYCYTSDCLFPIRNNLPSLAESVYIKNRQSLQSEKWNIIKKVSPERFVYFFHEIDEEVYNDPDVTIVRVEPDRNLNLQWILDRRWFGEDQDTEDDFYHHKFFFQSVCTTITDMTSTIHGDGQHTISFSQIFDTDSVVKLLKDLDLYHDGIENDIDYWIKEYISKNTRPDGIFTIEPPDEYDYPEFVDEIPDFGLRHYAKCVNRKVLADKNEIDDPILYLQEFLKEISEDVDFSEARNNCVDKFYKWAYSVKYKGEQYE